MLPTILQNPWLIICEGTGDVSFFRHLIQQRGLPPFDIGYPGKPETETGGRGGFGELLRALRVRRDFPQITAILVVSDSDEDPDGSFAEVRAQIASAGGYPVPAQPLNVATSAGFPAIVVMMLPWVGQAGNLETLCLPAMYERWPDQRNCLNAFSGCMATDGWPITRQSQMRLRSLIAGICLQDPNTSLTHAWSRNLDLIPLENSCFDQVADFLSTFGGLFRLVAQSD